MNNPLASYQRTQRLLRKEFDAFTRTHCPQCPTPCCRKPARIELVDIQLAEISGWKDKQKRVVKADVPVEAGEAETESEAGEPCDYLGDAGCSFPSDLRPFGCATFVCKYMYADLDRTALNRIRRLIGVMEEQYAALVREEKRKGAARGDRRV